MRAKVLGALASSLTHVRRVWLVAAVAIAVLLVSIVTLDLGPVLRGRAEAEASRWIDRPVRIGRLGLNLGRGRLVLDDVWVQGMHRGARSVAGGRARRRRPDVGRDLSTARSCSTPSR